ncbi:MAG: IclR family transcriptional regulator [Candidatus Dormibacteraeota bacterium]|nr:IclR family transcriptional regulator [Candidatus Dormibacteraeota bacterium]
MAAADSGTSLRRGLAILDALAAGGTARPGALGVVRLAELIGSDKSQVSRSLKILAEEGFVERDPVSLGYRLSSRFFALASVAGEQRLLAIAPPMMAALVGRLNERVHLSVLQGHEVLTVATESPNRAIEAAGWVGRTNPSYCTSSGRALLLDHQLGELKRLLATLEFKRLAPGGPRSVGELYRKIQVARPRGVVVVEQEFEPGLLAVAAPVRNFQGRIVAAVNVSAPKYRFAPHVKLAEREIVGLASDLSASLGYRPVERSRIVRAS